MENDQEKPTVSSPFECVVSAAKSHYNGCLLDVTFDGVFIRTAKAKVGARRNRNQMVRVIKTINLAH